MELENDPTVRRKTAPLRFHAPARRPDSQEVDNVVTTSGGPNVLEKLSAVAAAPQDDSTCQTLSFKIVKDVTVSLYEFRKRKFDVINALRMEFKKEQLNIYGNVCETAVKEPEAVAEASKGPANSEYGEKERLEARKKKYKMKDYNKEVYKEQISLKIQDESSLYHKMKGSLRNMEDVQGSYYIFMPGPNGFEAHPVSNWYDFEHEAKNNPMTEEEADVAFKKRDKILNYFNVMVEKKLKGGDGNSDGIPRNGTFDTDDGADVGIMESSDSESGKSGEEGCSKKKKRKLEKKSKEAKERKLRINASIKNEEGIGYCEDTSSSDSDDKEDSNYQCGVAEEDGLRTILLSEDDSEEEAQTKLDQAQTKLELDQAQTKLELDQAQADKKTKGQKNNTKAKKDENKALDAKKSKLPDLKPNPKSSSSTLLRLKKKNFKDWKVANIIKSPKSGDEECVSLPRKALPEPSPTIIRQAIAAGVTLEAVRRYLSRKPMGIPDLLKKFSSKKDIPISELTSAVGYYIKKLNPHKELVQGRIQFFIPTEKDVSSQNYFSSFGKDQ